NNPYAPTESFHMSLGAYEATAFGVAAVYAWAILRGRRTGYERKGFFLGMAVATLIAPLQVWVGDINAELVASYQPIKLASMELVFHTTRYAPELLGGWPNGQSVRFGFHIPDLLSWLAFHNVTHPIIGLDSVPRFFWPPYQYIHVEWQLMLLAGGASAAMTAFFWLFLARNFLRNVRRGARHITENVLPLDGFVGKLMLLGGVALGPLTFLAILCGWGVTEMGRQPWVVYGKLLVADAVQPAPYVNISFIIFVGIYVILGLTLIYSLLHLARETIKLRTPRAMVMAGGDE
ncbi:MAG: cytochrome ubiquinol oxidase subunit I, partial [Ktedonobacterales bacterium]